MIGLMSDVSFVFYRSTFAALQIQWPSRILNPTQSMRSICKKKKKSNYNRKTKFNTEACRKKPRGERVEEPTNCRHCVLTRLTNTDSDIVCLHACVRSTVLATTSGPKTSRTVKIDLKYRGRKCCRWSGMRSVCDVSRSISITRFNTVVWKKTKKQKSVSRSYFWILIIIKFALINRICISSSSLSCELVQVGIHILEWFSSVMIYHC